MIVDGDAAAALGSLVRDRWHNAADNNAVGHCTDHENDVWPPAIQAVLKDVDIGIARTMPAYREQLEVREVERLYLDSIEAAEKFIYIENQYLSCHAIGDALSRSLQQEQGPEVIIVMPEKTGGWLEQHTMDVLRARLLQNLVGQDRHDRLRIYYVQLASDPPLSLMIHAKVMIIDDCFARVASSNLSNRSMGLDSECDLAVQSGETQNCGEAITRFRRQLLAEHLGVTINELAAAEEQQHSLIAAIETLCRNEPSLQPLSCELPEENDWVPESQLIDPEKPVEPDEFIDYVITPEQRTPAYRYAVRIGLLVLLLLAIAALWRWTSLSDWLDKDRVIAVAQFIKESSLTPLLVLSAFIAGSLAMVPVTLMIIASVTVFGAWWGAAYALVGAELAAISAFAIGHLMGREAISRIAGSRLNRVSRQLSERGVLTIISLRIIPVAPFTVINVIAGISEIRLRDFAIGSFIGSIPGILSIAFLADRIDASLHEQSAASLVTLVSVVLVIVVGLIGLRRWLRGKNVNYQEQD
jgi:uncharacterized membrane protein YdjX (TVP38/TMEM64 family)